MLPSAQEVEVVILNALGRGDWAKATVLLTGAVMLRCVPTVRAYAEVMAATARHSTWEHTIRIIDFFGTSPLSVRALLCTAADALLEKPNQCAAGKLFAIIFAAQRRHVHLEAHHRVQCGQLLADAGDWRRTLMLGAQGQLIRRVPALVPPMMLAAATANRWVEGSIVMSEMLASGSVPSGEVAGNFIRCFTPSGPWWRALAVVSVLTCSEEANVVDAAHELFTKVKQDGKQIARAAKERQQAMLDLVSGRKVLEEISAEEGMAVLNELKEHQWEKALEVIRLFPPLLNLTPRPKAVLSPVAAHKTDDGFFHHWEFVWRALSSRFSNSPAEYVFDAATSFASYLLHGDSGKEGHPVPAHVRELAGQRVCCSITSHLGKGTTALSGILLHPFVRTACACGWWKDALVISKRPVAVFKELLNEGPWQAALAVFAGMTPNSRDRVCSMLEHLLISKRLWVAALHYAKQCLPTDTVPVRGLLIPLCVALGQWRRALHILDHYVSNPTRAETLLRKRCIVQSTEEDICTACDAGDWAKALRVWTSVYPSRSKRKSPAPKGDETQCEISCHVVMQLSKLLLDNKHFDACCVVLSEHMPSLSDCILLRCLQLFRSIRLSPLSYGKILQQHRECYKVHRILFDCYAALALCVSGNFAGAFSILQELTSLQYGKFKICNAVSHGIDEVPHLKWYVSLVLANVVDPSRAMELQVVMISLASCMKSPDDVNLFNQSLSSMWVSNTEELRSCAFHVSVAVLRHALAQGLPSPWEVLNIVAHRLDCPSGHTLTCLLYEAAVRRSEFDAQGNGDSGEGWRAQNPPHMSEDAQRVFERCAKAFGRGGLWEHALASLQRCESVDAQVLLRVVEFAKELRERRSVVARCVALNAVSSIGRYNEKGNASSRQIEDSLLLLVELQAWRAALLVFGSMGCQKSFATRGEQLSSSALVGSLFSCVATSGPWETSLRLLQALSGEAWSSCPSIDKGLTDVIRAVSIKSGAVMCSRLLLFMAEKMGYFPAADHYYMLLRSCLDSGLTFAEREFCAKNLKHLSHSINERQIINLVSSIGSSGMLHSSQCDENDHLISRSQIITHHEGKKRRFTSAGVWLTGDRPPLNPEELQRLCEVAPLIIVLSSHDMERLSRQFLGGRFASFELALLLHHYRLEVMESVEKGSDNFVNTELVEHCRKSKLVHILLLRYERPSRRVLRSGNKCSVRSFLEMIRWEVFKGLASVRTVALVWEVSLPSVSALAASRWSRVCEYELLTEVRRRAGRPPKSLSTRPSAARVEIAKYWSTYGRIVWPELFFSGPELCQIAVYVPLLESLLTREDHLLDLVSGIHASHFAAHSIPNEERLFRAPRSMEAIRAVINLVFSGLKRLHAELEVDSRGERRYYRYEPNKELWERIERDMQRRQGVPENSLIHTETEYRIPRWSLALHILHHYKRSTRATLDARILAVLFSACAADVAEMKHIDSFGQQQEKQSTTWWMLAICCAQCVEPNLTHAVWRSAIQLTSLTQVSKLQTTPPTETYKVEDIGDISLRATMRVVLCQAASVGRGGRIPFPTSLLLVEQLKELLADSLCFSPPSSSGIYQGGSDAGEHDALVVWHLLQSHHCFDKMEPLHVKLLQRVVLEDYDMSGDVECDGRGGGVLQLAFED